MTTFLLTSELYKLNRMSLFVDQNPAIEIRFKFRMIQDGGIEFLSAESDEECDEIICACKGRDFDTMSRVLEDSTIINHITGNAMVRTRNLYRGIVCNLLRCGILKTRKQKNKSQLHQRWLVRCMMKSQGRLPESG